MVTSKVSPRADDLETGIYSRSVELMLTSYIHGRHKHSEYTREQTDELSESQSPSLLPPVPRKRLEHDLLQIRSPDIPRQHVPDLPREARQDSKEEKRGYSDLQRQSNIRQKDRPKFEKGREEVEEDGDRRKRREGRRLDAVDTVVIFIRVVVLITGYAERGAGRRIVVVRDQDERRRRVEALDG